jgi:hypothetical protein
VAQPVPLDVLRDELTEWTARLEKAGEDWLTARAAGKCTDEPDWRYQDAARNTRRLQRRINRRTTGR